VTFYVDGSAVGSDTTSGINFTSSTPPLYIGAQGDGGSLFDGLIDEVVFFNRTLGPSILALKSN